MNNICKITKAISPEYRIEPASSTHGAAADGPQISHTQATHYGDYGNWTYTRILRTHSDLEISHMA